MRIFLFVAAAVFIVFAVAGCAPGPNQLADSPDEQGRVAGFWQGLWHGFIVLFTFVISLFSDSVRMYDVHNSGNLYDLGFLLGMMAFFGGSGGEACRRSQCRD
jgi:hypothetical protein